MMKNIKIIWVFVILGMAQGYAQNLVPNSSFEALDSCPQYQSKLFYASSWFQPNMYNGNTTNSCSSDLFNNCCTSGAVGVPINGFGTQSAKTGLGYAGIFCNVDTFNTREYIEVELLSPMIAGTQYCAEFYVSLADFSKKAVSDMGAYFSTDSLLDLSPSQALSMLTPQIQNDTGNFLNSKSLWKKVSGNFIASGGERFITIGNFKKPINTHVQNVSGGSVDFVYYYIDDISVKVCDTTTHIPENKDIHTFDIFPNPNNGTMTLEYRLIGPDKGLMEITDVTGKTVSRYTLPANADKLTITNDQLQNGIYIYHVSINGKVVKSDKLLIIK